MDKRLMLVAIFVFGLPIMTGKIRAHNIEAEHEENLRATSYMMGLNYEEALEEGEIINCFSWKEDHTVFEIEVIPFK